jgi:hypothetical protein
MKIYEIGRNDPCYCGSGKKYKKCCLPRVEEATRKISKAVEGIAYTPGKAEIVETLGFVCGVKIGEEVRLPDPDQIGRLLRETWEEEVKLRESEEGDSSSLTQRFEKLLDTKESLRELRLPASIFWSKQDDAEEEEESLVRKKLQSLMAARSEFLPWAAEVMALSLQHEDYTEEELRELLRGFSWAVDNVSNELFFAALFRRTAEDLRIAHGELERILRQESADEEGPFPVEEVQKIMERYRVYDELVSMNVLEETRPAYKAILDGKLVLEVPFYSVAAGVYSFLYRAREYMASLVEKGFCSENIMQIFRVLADVFDAFWEEEALFFIPEAVRALERVSRAVADEELAVALEKLSKHISLPVVSGQLRLTEHLYSSCVINLCAKEPITIPDPGWTVETFGDLLSQKFVENYCQFLKSQGKLEEAEHVEKQYCRISCQGARV